MKRGLFVTFEGLEGVGKSTQIGVFRRALEAQGIRVVETREPGGTPNAEAIRDILKSHTDEIMPPLAEMLLMFAARTINVANTIRPALDSGAWVVADRFTDSTRAYQGGGRGEDAARIEQVAEWAHGDTNPDVTVWLDAPAEVGLERAGKRGASDRFEVEEQDFFVRVRARYEALAEAEPGRIRRIDADRGLEAVSADVQALAAELVKHFKKS